MSQLPIEHQRLYQLGIVEVQRAQEALRRAELQVRVIELEIRLTLGLSFLDQIDWQSREIHRAPKPAASPDTIETVAPEVLGLNKALLQGTVSIEQNGVLVSEKGGP